MGRNWVEREEPHPQQSGQHPGRLRISKAILETAGLVSIEQRGRLQGCAGARERKGPYLPPAVWKFLWKATGRPGWVLSACVYERQDLICILENYFLLLRGPWVRRGQEWRQVNS